MLAWDLSTLEELDAVEAAAKEEATRLESSVLALSEASTFFADPAIDPEAFADLPLSFWDNLGYPGTASVSLATAPSGGQENEVPLLAPSPAIDSGGT